MELTEVGNRKWGAAGLESWEVIQYEGDAEYQIQATLVWKSREEFDKAISGPAGAEIFGDVPNFTTAKPILLKGLHKGKVSI